MATSLAVLRETTAARRELVHAAEPVEFAAHLDAAGAPVTVLDIAWDRPTIAQIQATGATGVMRYFSPDATKNLTAAEVQGYTAAGLAVGTVFESTAGRATQGRAAGVADAQLAERQRVAVGLPASHVHHFAVDEDTSWASVQAYFDGAASVVTLAREGCYGGFRVIEGAAAHGLRFLWQTVAWSGGQVSGHATLYQNGSTALAGAADINHALAANYGQYPSPLEPDMPSPQDYAAAVWAYQLAHKQSSPTDAPTISAGAVLGWADYERGQTVSAVTGRIDALAAKVASPPPVVLSDAQVVAMAAALAPAVADLLAERLAN